jgi:hypothetical protein
MKKTSTITAIAFALLLVGCTKNEARSSPVSSAPEKGTIPYYFAALKTAQYDSIKLSYTIKKGTTSYEEGYQDHEINPSEKIEYRYETRTTLSSLSDNSEKSVSKSSVYESADTVYAYDENDGTYHTQTKSRSAFDAYTLPYDYTLSKDPVLTTSGFVSTIKGTIAEQDLSAFGETKLAGVSDFAFTINLTKLEGYLQSFAFAYTKEGFSIVRSYAVSALAPNLTLPE